MTKFKEKFTMSDYEDGAMAALDGQDECTNPHPFASEAYGEWLDGWLDTSNTCNIRNSPALPSDDGLRESVAHVAID